MTSRNFVCSVDGCFNISGAPGISFFCIPKGHTEVKRREKWIEFLGPNVRVSRSSRLCSMHFAPEDFKGTANLRRTALPSIHTSHPVTEHGYSKSVVIKPEPIEIFQPDNEEDDADSKTDDADGGCMEDETYENSVIHNVKEELCRVCGNRDNSLRSIFENTSLENEYYVPLVKLLEMYLPLKIQGEDNLPSKICSKCLCTLNQWHELYVTCVAADKAFRNLFCQGTSEGDVDALVPRLPEEVVHCSIHDESSKDDLVCEMKEKTEDQLKVRKSGSDSKSDPSEDKTSCYTLTIEEDKIKYPEIHRLYCPQYACKYCYETFNGRCDLRAHYVSCQESHTLCDECGKILPRRRLVKHKSGYHSTKKLCEKCGKSFYPQYLYYHMMMKHSETFSCELCCKVIKTKDSFRKHQIKHETGEMKTTFKANPVWKGGKNVFVCPVCNLYFDDKQSLVMHLNKPKPVQCPSCKIKLKNEKLLNRHICKKWSCQYCSRSFNNKVTFLGHERIHTGEKPYKCNICDLAFRSITLRAAHKRTVHSEPTHECKYCSKKFHVASRLRLHMDAHESDGYLCPLCDKQLKRADTLQKHIKLHKMGKI